MSDNINGALHREVGELKGTVRELKEQVRQLHDEVRALTAVLNKGRGAKYLIVLLPAIIGLVSGFLSYFGIKFSIGH